MEVPQTVIQTVDRHVPKIEVQEIVARRNVCALCWEGCLVMKVSQMGKTLFGVPFDAYPNAAQILLIWRARRFGGRTSCDVAM